ncbi:unnamed protein product [Lymnaea stagnalis]|uniref:EGF-like domain-containing protein n=1 Tax=Lymnaea stagnalis TaxID=6523 RepID=A0AAV2HZB6_LYMST
MKFEMKFHQDSQNICVLNIRKMAMFLWIVFTSMSMVDGKNKPKCSVCTEIVLNFQKGLVSTAKSNFGGGNTKWEEKSLGSYSTSEVRLVEILEHICDDSSKECHPVLEEYEELVEKYWFQELAQKKDTNFYNFFCIDHVQACCPNNTYGPDCSQCPGGIDQPCSGNGKCLGEGTREGSGKCQCTSGYQGDLCNQCKDGFYEESKNDTHTVCKVCHIACKNTCWESGPKGCDECKSGWLANEDDGCQDINECLSDPCEENQYCTNTQGSYTCFTCDEACLSCTGPGSYKCEECNTGFTLNEETKECLDINECEKDSSLCEGEHTVCKNKPGNYECVCKVGYEMKDGSCVELPKEIYKSSKKIAQPPNLAEQLKKNISKRKELDWAKFKDIPSITGHFLVMAFYGISCRFASSSHLVTIALSLLMIIHVLWFATNSR